ncbi:MAG TPA: glycosyl hydrolase [Terriglobia bacterium]|nr:glycosyl hydrolase [Terriglobia bacterium]
MKRALLVVIALLVLTGWLPRANAAGEPFDLAAGFHSPPDAAKPWAYWWWLNGNVSKVGITKDLEEMKRQGINGVLIFHAGEGETPHGPLFLSPEWHELFRHALREASRLGMEVSVNLCDGWDSGGPWITPDLANKKLVYSEVQMDGRKKVFQVLPLPPVVDGYYHDVAVLAIPERPDRPVTPANVTASSSLEGYVGEWNFAPQEVADSDPETYWASASVMPTPSQPQWLAFEYHEPLAASGLYMAPAPDNGPRDCELQASSGGRTYTTVKRFSLEKGIAKRIEFPEVKAREFRLLITSAYGTPVQVAKAILLRKGDEPNLRRGIKWWWFKSGNRSFWDYPKQGPEALEEEYPKDGTSDVRSSKVLDITKFMNADGRLEWEAPPGRWTILRFGYTLEGQHIRAQSAGGQGGYEADMLSSAALETHFKNTAGPILDDVAATGVSVLKYLHIDSYELGADVRGQQPTWTQDFREEFKARRGYDLTPYLPALARRIVDSREVTDRFLTDFRWTIGDLMAERFWGRFAQLAHERGLGTHPETGYGTYPFPHIDGLRCAGFSDIPMGEFWYGTDIMSQFNHFADVIRTEASAAHIYGHRLVQAESFTAWTHWKEFPYVLKPVGDEAFVAGLNRIVFHQYTHQPVLDMKPGWEYFAGTHIDRNITWWEQARALFQYLARCQYLLQQGRFVADALYFYGEGVTKFVPSKQFLRPSLPRGYDFDAINADVLLHSLSVRDGRLALQNGMSYRVLALPEDGLMSVEALRKIEELVKGGATVLGPKPRATPGLADYPRSDAELQALAGRIWGDCDGQKVKERQYGSGQVVCGMPMGEFLREQHIAPDFEYRGARNDTSLNFIHRSDGEAEFYFVTNRKERDEQAECTFRVSAKQPELWDPVTGETRPARAFKQAGGRTTLPLEFAPYGSMFVVFRKPIDRDARGAATRNFPTYSTPQELPGPWSVSFDPKWGGPKQVEFTKLMSWTERPEEGIKYYSGTATYRKSFDLPPALQNSRARIALDLGDVKDLAQVRLNGRHLGVLWTRPFRVEITSAVKPTGNVLEIDVVNLWPNRIIGDAALPPGKRFTKTNIKFKKDEPLLESGLLGPVTLEAIEEDAK